ncbi:MAG: hypothetical protein ABI658_16585 [Acidimicrobiales bacterium]
MRPGGDDSFDPTRARARKGDLSAPRSAHRRNPDPMAALVRFVGEGAVEHAARSRSRTRWQHQIATEEGTWPGLMCDLAETTAMTVIDTHIGRRLQGTIVAVGSDFVTVATTAGGHVVLAIAAISAIHLGPGARGPVGRASTENHTTLRELLAELAVEKPTLTWHLTDRTSITGQLVGVSRGFVHLRVDGTPSSTSYLPVGDHTMVALDG